MAPYKLIGDFGPWFEHEISLTSRCRASYYINTEPY